MKKQKNDIKKIIIKCIQYVNSLDLEFDEKRYKIIEEMKIIYTENKFKTEDLLKRKHDIENSYTELKEFVIPFALGLVTSFFYDFIIDFYKHTFSNPLYDLLKDLLAIPLIPFLAILIQIIYRKLANIRFPYDKFGLKKYELNIIDSLLENRLEDISLKCNE